MNRRGFLAGLGAGLAVAAGLTRLAQTKLEPVAADFVLTDEQLADNLDLARYLTDPNAWYIKTDHELSVRHFYRRSGHGLS